jgi:hypothetical protein
LDCLGSCSEIFVFPASMRHNPQQADHTALPWVPGWIPCPHVPCGRQPLS